MNSIGIVARLLLLTCLGIAGCGIERSLASTGLPGDAPTPTQAKGVAETESKFLSLVDHLSQNAGWRQHTSMPNPRSEMPAAEWAGLIYVPGGYGGGFVTEATFEVYDPVSDAWASLAPMLEGRHHLMATAHQGKIYAFGGGRSLQDRRPTNTAWVYDPAVNAWDELANMPERRIAGAAVSLGDYIYIVGWRGATANLLRYDPATDAWASLAPLGQLREHTAAVVLDGKIYALAGRWQGVGELDSVEVYDPATDRWSPGISLDHARGGHAAAVLDGKIYVMGGEVLTGTTLALDSVEVFDPATGSWSPGMPMPVALHGLPAIGLDGRVYALGGSDRAGAIENHGRVFSLRP